MDKVSAVKSLRASLCLSACLAMFEGCGGSQPPIGAPGAMPLSRAIAQHTTLGKSWMLPEAKGGDLLYAASFGHFVDVFTYPKGKHIGRLTNLAVGNGLCSDPQGNVFIPVNVSTSESAVFEFSHGGTTPIATLSDPGNATSCSFDVSTGNLAVANYGKTVAIFQQAQGEPTVITASPVPAYYCAYDNAGNLFVDYGIDSAALGELPAGSNAFKEITLNTPFSPMSLQWDKDHLAIAGYTFDESGPQPFYNVWVSGSIGTVDGPVLLSTKNGKHPDLPVQFFLQGKTMMGPAPHGGGWPLIDFWNYPAGGSPVKTISHRADYSGGTISVFPRR